MIIIILLKFIDIYYYFYLNDLYFDNFNIIEYLF